MQRSTASQPAPTVTSQPAPAASQPAPGANSQPATTVQAKPAPTAPTATAQSPASDGAPTFTRELRYVRSGGRMYGEDVRRMQVRLMQLTGEDITKGGDGWFGPRTERGVRQFQERNGLPVTGVVDARTWAALFGTNAR